MRTLSRLLCFLGCIGLSFSTTNQTEDSWAKLEISPRAIASMPFLNYRMNIYESSGGLRTGEAKDRKYYYPPISLLDPQSAVGEFNNATREAEMRFRIYLWTEPVEKEIFNYLTKVVGVETSIHQVHVIPFEKVILVSTHQTVSYRVHKEWIPYQSDQYLEFQIICDTLEFCNHLAEQMRFNPQKFTHLKLQFSLYSQRSKRRETVIRIENIVSGSMFSKLDQQLPDSKEVYLTAADTKRLLSETVSNVLADTFSDDEILHQSAESAIYKSLEQFIVSGKTEISEQSQDMWDSVFWDQDSYRPDRSSNEISEVYRNSVSDAQQKMAETFSKSNKFSYDIGVTFAGYGFNTGFTTENAHSNSKEKEDFLKLMRESKDHVQWEGQKFVPKPIQLSRVNVAQIRNAQNFRDIRTQVTYSQSVLSTAIKTPIPSNAQSLELFVTESKFSDTTAQVLQKIADLGRTVQAQQTVTVQHNRQTKDLNDQIASLKSNFSSELKILSTSMKEFFRMIIGINMKEFFKAADKGDERFVRGWIQLGLSLNEKDPDDFNRAALYKAAKSRHTPVVEDLLKAGANPNDKDSHGKTPLHEAAWNGHEEAIDRLIQAGANPNEKKNDGWTPLHLAAWNGHNEVVDRLTAAGANPNDKDKDGKIPLHLAASKGHKEVVDRLIQAGANPNEKQNDGETPLHVAAENGHKEVVDRLIQAGANPNEKRNTGQTSLHVAAENGHKEVVDRLIQAGANPNEKNNIGSTPLHLGAWKGHMEIVKALLRGGASTTVQSNYGITPTDVALRFKQHEIAKILAAHKV